MSKWRVVNERFHQTLFRWLDRQTLASSLDELQAQVDTFDQIDNTERPHQGLPGWTTPETAWLATPKADPPRPTDDPDARAVEAAIKAAARAGHRPAISLVVPRRHGCG